MNEQIIIDAENAILGRLASYAAKQTLLGKQVIVVNSEKAVVSGNRANIISNYLQKRQRRGHSRFPSQPEQIIKRTIRGMLSYKMGRGEAALNRIKCYKGIPKEFEDEKKIKSGKENKNMIELKEISEMLK